MYTLSYSDGVIKDWDDQRRLSGFPAARKCGSRVRLADGFAHQIRADRLVTRGEMAHEYRVITGLRAFELELVGDSLAGGCRQGQHIFTPALGALKRNRTGAPVYVVQIKVGDLAAA